MKVIIENRFYPSLDDMDKCAEILHSGLLGNPVPLLSKEEDVKLKELLRKYSHAFKKHKDEVIDGMIKELDSL